MQINFIVHFHRRAMLRELLNKQAQNNAYWYLRINIFWC